MITQRELISQYNKDEKLQFNEKLFERSNDETMRQLLNVIKSISRNGQFIFRLHSYQIIEDYFEIQRIMCEYENSLKKGKNKKKINSYEYINLKDSDFILLIVNFYLKIKDVEKIIPIYICVPIYVNKYYFRISGNYYLPTLQIVDTSVFNSSTAKTAQSDSVIMKTILMSVKMYRNNYELTTTKNEKLKTTYFSMTAFKKTFGVFKYILAKYGFYGTLKFMGFDFIRIDKQDPNYEDYYTFKTGKLYISVPKYIYDNDIPVQSFICTMFMTLSNKNTKYNNVFTNNYWLEMLGGEFGRYTTQKGSSILESIEGIYDIATMEAIHLPIEYKDNIYKMLRWMLTEFSNLMARDNLDLSFKRVRVEEYFAAFYGMKLASIVHIRFSDIGANLDMELAEKYMRGLKPTFLLEAMCTSKFINYQSNVNDIDTMNVLKYTMNILPGLGEKEKKKTSLPAVFKQIHPSHLGRLDPDSSPKSSPGISGTLTPFCELQPDGSFSDFKEEITWDKEFNNLMRKYKQTVGLKDILIAKEKLFGENIQEELTEVECSIKQIAQLVKPCIEIEKNKEFVPIMIPLEAGGIVYYSK